VKRLKFLMVAVMATAIVCTPLLPANAATNGIDRFINRQNKGTTIQQTQQTRSQIKQVVLQKREQIVTLIASNLQLRQQALSKREAISQQIQRLKDSKITVPADTLNQIQTLNNTLKADVATLKGTNGSIAPLRVSVNQCRKNKDLTGISNGFDKIIAVYQSRNDDLTKINTDLGNLLSALQAIQSPASGSTTTQIN
jgi:hypothetical protein